MGSVGRRVRPPPLVRGYPAFLKSKVYCSLRFWLLVLSCVSTKQRSKNGPTKVSRAQTDHEPLGTAQNGLKNSYSRRVAYVAIPGRSDVTLGSGESTAPSFTVTSAGGTGTV